MKGRSVLSLLVIVFVAGVLVGIWIDAVKHRSSPRDFWYQIDSNQQASLRVRPKDIVHLLAVPGGPSVNMHFPLYDPCTPETKGSERCVIADLTQAPEGTYHFICPSDDAHNHCFDPGVHQSPSPPPFEFGEILRTDLGFAGGKPGATQSATIGSVAAENDPAQALVGCDGSKSVVQDQNGKPLPQIKRTVGDKIFWSSVKPFELKVSNSPPDFCQEKDFPQTPTATCTLNSTGTLTYTVTATDQSGKACSPSDPFYVVASPAPTHPAGGSM